MMKSDLRLISHKIQHLLAEYAQSYQGHGCGQRWKDQSYMEALSNRHKIYQDAFQRNPLRWINGKTRDWTPAEEVSINMNKNNYEIYKKAA